MNFIFIMFASMFGGFIQTITGFGSGIVIMLFLPYIFSVMKASALNNMITIILNFILVKRFYKYIDLKKVIIPVVISFITNTLAVYIGSNLELNTMKMIFSVFLIILALYFIFFSDNIKLKDNFLTMFTCSALAGITNGFFGIGGPPMALYYLTITNSKEEYIGTTQLYFFLNSIYTTSIRILSGIITIDLVAYWLPGVFAVLVGEYLGIKIINKISHKRMKQLMYYFLAISGVLTLLQCL